MTIEPRGIADLINLMNFQISAWHDFGYKQLPEPDSKPVPPLGERSAKAIEAGHAAVQVIDDLARQLYRLRGELVGELREDEDIRSTRVDRMLAGRQKSAGGGAS